MAVPKLLIDTDAGVDDAMALLMALHAHKEGRVQVVGITTVFGNTTVENVVKNVCRVLEIAQCKEVS